RQWYVLLEGIVRAWYVWQRCWRAHSQETSENPFCPLGRRRRRRIDLPVIEVGGQREHASLPKQSGALGDRPCDPAIFRSRKIRDAIVPRKPLVEECVVSRPQIQRTSVLTKLAFNEQLGFTAESST